MMGIRVSTGRHRKEQLNSSSLTALDYNLKTKINFPPEGSVGGGSDNTDEMVGKVSKSGVKKVFFPTPPHKLKFMFKFKGKKVEQ